MTFLISWLALSRGSEGYVTAGFLARSPRGPLRFIPLPGFESATDGPQRAALQADAEGRAPEVWDYLLERGIGAQSSFSEPISVVAIDFDDLADKVLPMAPKVQFAGEGASG